VALFGSVVTVVYPVAGLAVLAVAAFLAWRYSRGKRAARSRATVVDLPSVITVGPPGRPPRGNSVPAPPDEGQHAQLSVAGQPNAGPRSR
jgi:hypothetical protein